MSYVPEKVADRIDFERGEKSRSAYVAELLDNLYSQTPMSRMNQ
jgi:hypothetical protein